MRKITNILTEKHFSFDKLNKIVEQLEQTRGLSLYAFVAASMLGIFSVWLWSQIVNIFFQISEVSPIYLLATYSYYIISGTIIFFLALKRNQSEKIIDGIIISVVTLITTTLYILVSIGTYSSLIFVLIISFPIGGYLGAKISARYNL